MRFRTILIFSFFSIFLLPTLAHAQLTPEDAVTQLSQNVSVILDPVNPKPNDLVNITLQSYATDLDQSKISWSVGNKVIQSGMGLRTFSIQLGGQGSSQTVNVIISPTGATPFTKTIVLSPSDVDMLSQGNTYTPPFYKGLPLWSSQSSLVVFAVPHVSGSNGKEINRSTLIYKWAANGDVVGNQSGVGKSSLRLNSSIFPAPQTIRVDVSTGGDTLASGVITLAPATPALLVYEDSPLLGPLFNAEVGSDINLREKEITFSAYPYFFGTNNKNDSNLKYSWSANGSAIGQSTNVVTFRSPNEVGVSNLSIHLDNPAMFTQTADKFFNVEFGNENNF